MFVKRPKSRRGPVRGATVTPMSTPSLELPKGRRAGVGFAAMAPTRAG